MGKARLPHEGLSPRLTDPGELRQGWHFMFSFLPVHLGSCATLRPQIFRIWKGAIRP